MPIRTHRGRAAVYRRLWGWPLRSPRHLVAAAVGLVVVIAAVGFFLPEPQSSSRPSSRYSAAHSAQYEPSPTPSTEASPPSFSVPQAAPPPAAPDPAGLQSAHAWARAWVDHPKGTSKGEWLERLRPRTSPEFLPEMESIALENVPSKITGPPKPTESSAKSMTVRLPTDHGGIAIMMVKSPDGWQVAGYDKAV